MAQTRDSTGNRPKKRKARKQEAENGATCFCGVKKALDFCHLGVVPTVKVVWATAGGNGIVFCWLSGNRGSFRILQRETRHHHQERFVGGIP